MDDFDYSGLSPALSRLSKPAQRALLNNGICTPEDLSRITLKELLRFHGMGKGSLNTLTEILREQGFNFAE